MSVYKQNGSKYYRIQFVLDGKTYVKSSRTTSKKLALEIERAFREEIIKRVKLGIKDRISFKDAMAQYRETKRSLRSFETIEVYLGFLESHFQKIEYLDEITTTHVERMIHERRRQGRKPQTIKYCVVTLRGIWKLAKKLGYEVSPIEFPNPGVGKPRTRFLSADEEKRLLAVIDPANPMPAKKSAGKKHQTRMQRDLHDIVVTLLDTGGRRGEAMGLKWEQVDFQNRQIMLRRSKVDNESFVPMPKRLFDVLFKRFQNKGESEYVFPSADDPTKPKQSIRRVFLRALKLAGIEDVTLHTLRHTYASKLAQNGVSLQQIGKMLGHADTQMSARYAHLVHDQVVDQVRDVLNGLNNAAVGTARNG